MRLLRLLTLLFVLILAACQKSADKSTPAPGGKPQPVLSAAECYSNLRQGMKSATLLFLPVSEGPFPSTIEKTNDEIKSETWARKEFKFKQVTGKADLASVGIDRFAFGSGQSRSFEYSLAVDTEKSEWPFQLNLVYKTKRADSVDALKQTINYSSECRPQLAEASSQHSRVFTNGENKQIASIEVQNFTAKRGLHSAERRTAEVRKGRVFSDSPEFDRAFLKFSDLANFVQRNPNFYMFGGVDTPVGYIDFKQMKKVPYASLLASEESRDALVLNIDFANGQTRELMMIDGPRDIRVERFLGQDTLSGISESEWDSLGFTSFKSFSLATVSLSDDYFGKTHPPLTIKTHESLDYDNLKEYYSIISQKAPDEGESRSPYTYVLQPVTRVEIKSGHYWVASTDRKFLKETKLIQANHPEIQAMAKELKEGFNGYRSDMATKILEKVNQRISYDYEALNSNMVEVLRTEDVLRANKGVCQHFSNLFVALARAVGIPARMVIGYLLSSNSAGAHGWVEILLEDGRWVPLEPQSKTTDMAFYRYFPLTVGYSLDDPDDQENAVRTWFPFYRAMEFTSSQY